MSGMVFGFLTVTERDGSDSRGQACWKCICKCGNSKSVNGNALRSGHVKSCGCQKLVGWRNASLKHGQTKTRTWKRWVAMKRRCVDPAKASSYKNRGIQVCERWSNSFESFLTDVGECPSDQHTLDRIDNDLGYEPGNCRWATMKEQCQNRRAPQKAAS